MFQRGKKVFIILFVLASLARFARIFLPAASHAPHQEHPNHEAPVETAPPAIVSYEAGDVVAVDPGGVGFTLHATEQGKEHETYVRVSPSTLIRFGVDAVAANEIRPGDYATVSYASFKAAPAPEGIAKDIRLARAQ